MKKRIALLYGGAGKEHDVSLMGYEYVSELLSDTDYDVIPVYISRSGEWFIGGEDGARAYLSANLGGSLYTDYGFIRIDAAIPLLHGDGGEDGYVQGALSVAGIPCVGADVSASAVCIDKFYTKAVAVSLGIPTADYVIFSKPTDVNDALGICKEKLGLPIFIKPRRLGSSVGAYPIYNEREFLELFPISMNRGNNLVIAEKLISEKREIECALVEIGGRRIITAPGEILIDGFYGYDEKYGGRTKAVARADIDADTAETIAAYAEKITEALSLKQLSRIDFFLTDEGVLFNEVNTFPGFTSESLYPKMLKAAGIDPKDALSAFIEDILSC